jgi:hypothetical protein
MIDEPVRQAARFGPIRADPPAGVMQALGAGRSGWSSERLGAEGGFPNGGMWRFCHPAAPAASVVVKRTGPQYLGDDHVWRAALDPEDAQWWGREAEFYRSPLAVEGWAPDCRAARCWAVDDHDTVRELWLEDVPGIPLPRAEYGRVVGALARWQMHHRATELDWLSQGWIPAHLQRRALDNARTLRHPAWPKLIAGGLPATVREFARQRITDPAEAAAILDSLPQALTHYDFHHMNLGRNETEAVIIDWATVGWGPVGHDVGFMLIDQAPELGAALPGVWDDLTRTYADALQSAGGNYTVAEVQRSVAISNVLRLGWMIDYVLDLGSGLSEPQLITVGTLLDFLATLHSCYVRPAP